MVVDGEVTGGIGASFATPEEDAPIAPVALNNALRDISVMTRCPYHFDGCLG